MSGIFGKYEVLQPLANQVWLASVPSNTIHSEANIFWWPQVFRRFCRAFFAKVAPFFSANVQDKTIRCCFGIFWYDRAFRKSHKDVLERFFSFFWASVPSNTILLFPNISSSVRLWSIFCTDGMAWRVLSLLVWANVLCNTIL